MTASRASRLHLAMVVFAVAIAGTVVGSILIAMWYLMQNTSPWFGRGASLPKLPYSVVIGPVDASKGVAGLVEIGMTRREVVRRIGVPLIAGMATQEAARRGFIDPEDVAADFFDGIFAWVQYGDEERVISIEFNLQAFAAKLHGSQRVLLTHRGRTYLLGRNLSKDEAVAMLTASGATIRDQGFNVVIEGSGTALGFDEKGSLRTVTIMAM